MRNIARDKKWNEFRLYINLAFATYPSSSCKVSFKVWGFKGYDESSSVLDYPVMLEFDFMECWLAELAFDVLYYSNFDLTSNVLLPFLASNLKSVSLDELDFLYSPPLSLIDFLSSEEDITLEYPHLHEFRIEVSPI